MVITIWIANQTIALNTLLAKSVGSSLIVNETTRIASLDQGGSPITYILTEILHSTNVTGLVTIGAIYAFCVIFTALIYRARMRERARATGSDF
jgi:PTS system galactitol-specific IIC component